VIFVSEQGEDVAGAIVLWHRRGPYRTLKLAPYTSFSAFLTKGALDESRIHTRQSPLEMLVASLEKRYHQLSLLLHPAFTDIRVFTWRGWNVQPLYTYQIALPPDRDLIQAWSNRTRQTFLKARPSYHFEERADAAGHIAELNHSSYLRQERGVPLERGLLQRLIDHKQKEGQARCFFVTARGEDEPAGGVSLLMDDHTAFYWVAGSSPGPAMTVLLGELLPLLQKEGLDTFDLVGANTVSIAEFKRRFGPQLLPYYLVKKSTRPELRYYYRLRG